MSVGKNIKIFRINAGIKQKSLAAALGMEVTYLSAIETDKKEPSLSLLRRIAEELKVPLAILFWEEHEVVEDESPMHHLKRSIFELAKSTASYATSSKVRN